MRALALGLVFAAIVGGEIKGGSTRTQSAPPSLQGGIELTIGGVDETRDAYIFGNVNGLALLEDGRILVADNTTHDVRAFGPDGRHLFTFGRVGAGPGDLQRPCCITSGPDRRLWIRDVGNRRYSLFELDSRQATFVRTIRGIVASPRALPDRIQWNERGLIIDIGQLPDERLQRAFLDSTGNAMRWDSLKPPPAESLAVLRSPRRVDGGQAIYYYYQPHGPTALRAHGPRGETAEAVSSNYAVSWFDAARRRITLLQRNVVPPGLSARERREADKELDDVARQTGTSRGLLPFDVPTRKPPLRSLTFDLDGRLWIERSVPDGRPREADVYERDGRRVSVMSWPAHVSLRHGTIKARTAVGVAVDSLGTNTVVRLRFR
jgi:hypothetical protein